MDYRESLRALATPIPIAVSSAFFLAAYLFYQWLLPKPIPGISYSKFTEHNLNLQQ